MKKFIKSSLGFTLLLLLGFSLLRFVGIGPAAISLNFGEDGMSLSGPEESFAEIYYRDIQSIELAALEDVGSAISGGEKNGVVYGRHRNGAWGDYTAFFAAKTELCIVLYTQQGVVAFSYESTETTRQLFEALPELLEEKGLDTEDMIIYGE